MKTLAATTYNPIPCGFHDYLEHFATLRKPINVSYFDKGREITHENAVIYDLSGGRNGEFVHVRTASEELTVRADFLISVDTVKMKDFGRDSCRF